MPLVSLAPAPVLSVPVLSVPVLRVSAPVRAAPLALSAPAESVAPIRPGLALVSTPPTPVYPDVSGRATPAEDVSWAARLGAKAPRASAVASAVR
jgi:hypothetical protein